MMRISSSLGLSGLVLTVLCARPDTASATEPGWWDSAWTSRVEVQIDEPGEANRDAEYVDLLLDFPPGSYIDLAAEVRVIDSSGTERPSLVHSHTDDHAHVLLNLSLPQSASETVHVYFGNPAAIAPAYDFPSVPAIFYVNNPDKLVAAESNVQPNYEGLSLFGQISIAISLENGNTGYDASVARQHRIAFVTAVCTTEAALAMTSIYEDVSLWGVTGGNCLEQTIFGLTDDLDPPGVQVPPMTDYITQDFVADQMLSYSCNETAFADNAVLEVVSEDIPNLGCLVRFDGGTELPNMEDLHYRSYFSGEIDPFDADATTLHTRAAEYLLQENRVSVTPAGRAEDIDADDDFVSDRDDNCVDTPNSDQADSDEDAIGDACDVCPGDPDDDIDGDSICGDADNCPEDANPDQADEDGNGVGDACDELSSGDSSSGTTDSGTTTGDAESTGGPDSADDGTSGDPVSDSTSTSGGGSTGGAPPSVDGEQPGCGCRSLSPSPSPSGSTAGLLVLLGLIRRRRARS